MTHRESGSILALQSDILYILGTATSMDLRLLAGAGIGVWYFTPGKSEIAATPRQYPQYGASVTTEYTGIAIEAHPMTVLDIMLADPIRMGVGAGLSIAYTSMWTEPEESPVIKLKPERYDGLILSPRFNASLTYTF